MYGVIRKSCPTERATDTVELCLKVFAGIGVEVSPMDIDVAHRVPARSQDGRRRGNLPIICKFTRRMVRDEVLSKRRNCNLLLPATFGLNPENELRISIFGHLTPRLQEIFWQDFRITPYFFIMHTVLCLT